MYKKLSLRIITGLMLLSLPFIGSDCEEILNSNPTGDITGSWTLIYNAGTTLDICPGETVNYPSSTGGTATLQCPDASAISRPYSISGSTLTYTDSGVQYSYNFTQNNELLLTGINNNRILYYSQTITGAETSIENNGRNSFNHNSSELK
ncbi:MAG: hypothetical protein K8I03_03700 [Ignavibacteria bacterium]|nr:hypothetical protein [Ignavibacteria bacterium]